MSRLLRIVNAAALAGIYVLAAWALVVLVACIPHPVAKAKIWPTGAPTGRGGSTTWFYCLAGTVDGGEGGLLCADTEETCRDWRSKALKYGGMAHVTGIGDCTFTQVEP